MMFLCVSNGSPSLHGQECFWELCTNDYCLSAHVLVLAFAEVGSEGFQSSTYRNEALGDYLTLRGYVQDFRP